MQLVSPALTSSNINALGYMQATNEMQVQFKNGVVYSYAGVPEEVYTQVFNGSIFDPKQGRQSVGHSFYVLVKRGGYSYTKIGMVPMNDTPNLQLPTELPPFVQQATEVAAGIGTAVATGTEILGDALQNFTQPVEVPVPVTTTQDQNTNPEGLPPTL